MADLRELAAKCWGTDARPDSSISLLLKRRDQRAADLWRDGGGSAPPRCQQRRLKQSWTAALGGSRRGGAERAVGGADEKQKLRCIWIKTHARGSLEARSSVAGSGSAGRTRTSATRRYQRRAGRAGPPLRWVSFHRCPSAAAADLAALLLPRGRAILWRRDTHSSIDLSGLYAALWLKGSPNRRGNVGERSD